MSGEKVLLAEDDAAIRTVVSRALSRQGYDVQATSVAAALWRWIAAGDGDVVITDVALARREHASTCCPASARCGPTCRSSS